LAALAYHFVAGVKHLFMDMGYGETLESGPVFAKVSMALAVVLIVLAGVWVW
jgi:succinate dehydrogenase / fumarate reductase cytochrome b subunit